MIKGEAHPVNSSFITSDCSSQCICMVGGVASCMDLCPRMLPKCPPGTTLKEEDGPVGSGGVSCSCIRRYCVPAKGMLVSLFASTCVQGFNGFARQFGNYNNLITSFSTLPILKCALCN